MPYLTVLLLAGIILASGIAWLKGLPLFLLGTNIAAILVSHSDLQQLIATGNMVIPAILAISIDEALLCMRGLAQVD